MTPAVLHLRPPGSTPRPARSEASPAGTSSVRPRCRYTATSRTSRVERFPARPHLAGQGHRQGPQWCAVDLRDGQAQSTRWPSASGACSSCVQMGYKEIGQLPLCLQTDFDFGGNREEHDPRRRLHQVWSAATPDPPHLRPARAQERHRALLQPRSCSARWSSEDKPAIKAGHRRRAPDQEIAVDYPDTTGVGSTPESCTGTEVEFAKRSVTGHQIMDPNPDNPMIISLRPPSDDHPSLRRHHRVDARISAVTRCCCPAPTTTVAPAWPPPSWATWPARTASGCLFGGRRTGNVDLVAWG